MNRARLFTLTRRDLPDLLERSIEVAPMDARRKIFVNRNLRLDRIEVIGFDMDYTLAIYRKLNIEKLAFDLTVEKLIAKRAYPDAIRGVRYEPDRVIRGLVCDKANGNIFKMDRYGHIGRVFHGAKELPKDQRISLYRQKKMDLDAKSYAWVDTLFALPEACLYSQLVDFVDALPEGAPRRPDYRELYEDIRFAIDEVHADNSLKRVIKADPATYIEREVELAHALHRFRSSGKRLFLLTNSLWDYTDAVMRYLLEGMLEGYPSWKNYFDYIVVGAKKPGFFVNGKQLFHEVDEATHAVSAEPAQTLVERKVYQGGNLRAFEKLAHFSGERVLYVGDHIYGDILRSKKSSLWRTCMVIPELEDVVWHQDLYAADLSRYGELEDEMRRVDYEINYYKTVLSSLSRLREGARAIEAQAPPAAAATIGASGGAGSLGRGVGDSAEEPDIDTSTRDVNPTPDGRLPAPRPDPRPADPVPEPSTPVPSLEARPTAPLPPDDADHDPDGRKLLEATRVSREALDRLKAQLRAMVKEHNEIEQRVDMGANPAWGLTFTEGSETSLFGKQVEDYACLYTSRVSNFVFYSPLQFFRSPPHAMPHERLR